MDEHTSISNPSDFVGDSAALIGAPLNASVSDMEDVTAVNPEYLESFNIDTEVDPVYNETNVVESPSVQKIPNSTLDGNSSTPQTDGLTPSSPMVGRSPTQPFFLPMYAYRTRGRGRVSTIPLDDVMEKKIRTYEGGDCAQQLEQLHQQFPRFKKAYINRIFTRNMLNYDITYHYLKQEDDKEIEKFSKVRLIQSPKTEDGKRAMEAKSNRSDAALQQHAFVYMGLPLGRCPPHVANSLYRRVVVTPEGNVEPAEEHEQKFLDSTSLSSSFLNVSGNIMEARPRLSAGPNPSVAYPTVSPRHSSKMLMSNSNQSLQISNQIPELNENSTPPANKFFRTNRICDTEMKKRGYLNRELRNAIGTSPSNRQNANTVTIKTDSGANEDSHQLGDAVKYMAKVGVVSNSSGRKRAERRSQAQPVVSPSVEDAPAASDTDDGLKLNNEERKQLLSFFNEATVEELTLLSGCSSKTAQTLLVLRPFKHTVDLVNRTSNLRHLSANLIESSKDILQIRSSVVRLLQRCERITEKVACHATRLLENSISLPENIEESGVKIDGKTNMDDFDMDRNNEDSIQLLTQQPAILNPVLQLKPYQLVGLNWLRLLHHEEVNGILADEMGLGKTVQAIAFLASLWENGDRGPHLIICPSSTQDNWQRELSLWCSNLKVLVYQGSAEVRKTIRLKIYENVSQPDFNVLLTSYAVGTSSIEDRALMKRINFHYGIFDEAHMLKNMTSQRYRNLMNFRVQRRLLLTGTPLQNNLLELVSLLSFVMPEMFMRSTELLKRIFQIYAKPINSREQGQNTDTSRSTFEEERLVQAKNLLQPFCFRRLKSQVLSQLPPKTTEVIHVPMTASQSEYYLNLVKNLRTIREADHSKSNGNCKSNSETTEDETLLDLKDSEDGEAKKLCLDEHGKVNGVTTRIHNINTSHSPANMVAKLRKAANHQVLLSGIAYSDNTLRDIADALHMDASHANADPQLIYEDLASMSDHQVHKVCLFYEVLSPYTLSLDYIISGSGKIQWLDENLPKLISDGHRILIFSQFVIMLDVLEEYLRHRNRRYLRLDGNTVVNERQALIDRFNSSSIEVFLLSTRAGGLGINLTGADTVIIHDIDFNPYNDRQAEDRCHRLGQKNPVHVIRLVTEGTVEDGMLRIANEKLRLEQDVTSSTTIVDESYLVDMDEEDDSGVPKTNQQNDEKAKLNHTEPDNTFKVLGPLNLSADSRNLDPGSRINERDVRSLLSEALKL